MPYKDPEAQKKYRKKYYHKNRQKAIDYSKKSVKERKTKALKLSNRYKTSKGCVRCKYNKCAQALHFHHNNPKDKHDCISYMINNGLSIKRIKNEIRKCSVICANCHAEIHWSLD